MQSSPKNDVLICYCKEKNEKWESPSNFFVSRQILTKILTLGRKKVARIFEHIVHYLLCS